ncbi:MAG: GNAT family N-acetyltransferase [Acidiphilium sp.]
MIRGSYSITPIAATALAGKAPSLGRLLVDCIAAGAALGFRHPLDPARAVQVFTGIAQQIDAGSAKFLVAETVTGMAGCIGIFADSRETEPHLAELGKLMVHPLQRRLGIGATLIAAAEAEARDWGKTRLYLFTNDADAAPVLYDKAGYSRVGRIPEGGGMPDGGIVDALIFSKSLASAI